MKQDLKKELCEAFAAPSPTRKREFLNRIPSTDYLYPQICLGNFWDHTGDCNSWRMFFRTRYIMGNISVDSVHSIDGDHRACAFRSLFDG